MTHPPLAPAAEGDDADGALHAIIRVSKMLNVARHRAPDLDGRVDGAAYPLLFAASQEQRRISDLAACVHSDVSTVSRQVSALVGHGLVERVPDPDDGRAQVVRITESGRQVIADLRTRRSEFAARLLAQWSDEEVARLRADLERLVATFEEHLGPTHPTSPRNEAP